MYNADLMKDSDIHHYTYRQYQTIYRSRCILQFLGFRPQNPRWHRTVAATPNASSTTQKPTVLQVMKKSWRQSHQLRHLLQRSAAFSPEASARGETGVHLYILAVLVKVAESKVVALTIHLETRSWWCRDTRFTSAGQPFVGAGKVAVSLQRKKW